MAVHEFLELADSFPEVLNHEMLSKINCFLLYAPRFKNDILLAQPSNWPASEAPLFLPESVAILLSHICDIDQKSTEKLWSYIRERVWDYVEEAKVVDERFKVHSGDLNYSEFQFHRSHFLARYANVSKPVCTLQ